MAVKQEEINEAADSRAHAEAKGDGAECFVTHRKCSIPASVFMPDRNLSLPCRIVDLSGTGAEIIVGGSQFTAGLARPSLPDAFWLCLAHDGSQVRCRVAWQTHETFGIRFVSPMQPMARRRAGTQGPAPEEPNHKAPRRRVFGKCRV